MLSLCPAEAHFFIYTKDKIVFEERKHEYELVRLHAFYTLSPHFDKKKNTIKKPSDLLPFPWDQVKIVPLNLEEYTEEAFKKLDEKYKNPKTFIKSISK